MQLTIACGASCCSGGGLVLASLALGTLSQGSLGGVEANRAGLGWSGGVWVGRVPWVGGVTIKHTMTLNHKAVLNGVLQCAIARLVQGGAALRALLAGSHAVLGCPEAIRALVGTLRGIAKATWVLAVIKAVGALQGVQVLGAAGQKQQNSGRHGETGEGTCTLLPKGWSAVRYPDHPWCKGGT